MKSERRHELQTNTLADWTGHQIDNVKPHLNLILTVVLAAVAVLLAWVYFREWNSSRTTAAWTDFYSAANSSDAASLVEMAQKHAGEPASVWALLLASDVQLEQGAEQAFRDRKEAETSLKQAAEGYETVLKDPAHGRTPLLRRRAMFGLAESHETLFAVTGDKESLEAAKKYYTEVAKAWPDTVLGRTAREKDAALASRNTQEFLAWFSKQEPIKTEPPGEMGEGPASAGSQFDLTTLPGADELLLPEEEAAAPGGPEITPPATEDASTPKNTEAPPAAESSETETPEAQTTPEPAAPNGSADAPESETSPAAEPENKAAPDEPDSSEETPAEPQS